MRGTGISGTLDAIGDRLRRTRKALGLSQAALCRLAKIATNTYNQWENGTRRPELDQAMRLCETFRLTLDWLYRGDASGLPPGLAARIAEGAEPEQAPAAKRPFRNRS